MNLNKRQRVRVYKRAYELFNECIGRHNKLGRFGNLGICHFLEDAVIELYPDHVLDTPSQYGEKMKEVASYNTDRGSYWWPVGLIWLRRQVFERLIQGKCKEDKS